MSRDYRLFLEDMQTSSEKIVRYTRGLNKEEFLKDEKTYDAVVRNLTVIGEAVKHIPDKVRENYVQLAWREIAGFRDIAIHEYFGIDEEILWDIIQNEVPSLLAKINGIIAQEEHEEG
jgi:uncharacterized protein with HEPN domain